ncbi:hypothetical protein [Enterobacter hormaechei]|uniref:hypothetical protein n=1 Tax=Enterobacter hormaechei TaxID=158836 RepID=UPI00388CF164
MSTLTHEWLLKTIAEIEEERDAVPGAVNEDAARALEAMKIALASLEAEAVTVNDDMAYAFHHALSDSSLGADEAEEIKAGLRAAFANVTAPTAPVSVPDAMEMDDDFDSAFEHGKAVGWNACRAAMLQGAENAESRCAIKTAPPLDSLTKNAESRCGNSPVIQDGWVLVPEEPTHEMLEAGDEQFGTYDVYRRMIAAAPQQEA